VLSSLTYMLPEQQLRDGTLREQVHDVLAWVLYTHDVAVNSGLIGNGGPVGPSDHAPAVSVPCEFLDAFDAINATTGQGLGGSGETPERDPIRL